MLICMFGLSTQEVRAQLPRHGHPQRSVRGRPSVGIGLTSVAEALESAGGWTRGSLSVELDPDLGDLLEEMGRPPREAARELIVLGLYAQGEISSGRAAQLLGISRDEFIHYASQRGIPYFQMSPEELRRDEYVVQRWRGHCGKHGEAA